MNDLNLPESAAPEAVPNSQLQVLRSRVESELGKPAVILVTSAAGGDGSNMTAHLLAGCFMESGHRTALVDLTVSGARRHDVTMVELPHADGKAIGRERLAAFVEEMRSSQDFTIVDAGTFLNSATAMALAWLVDGILLAVRVGRAPTDEDELMVQTIAHSRGRVIGVVATSQEAVATFERTQANTQPVGFETLRRGSEPLRARPYSLSTDSLAKLEI
jgi:Mrp family chromosome partitioning ATPase